MKFFATDIKDKKEFDRIGYHYTQVRADDEHHIYLYEMKHTDPEVKIPYKQYELVKGRKHVNPDNSISFAYPCDEDFGTYGWYICGSQEKCIREIEQKWLNLTGRVGNNEVIGNGWTRTPEEGK